ncbi:hypothetical protein Tco_0717592 [Tanacetum coccineum]
MDLGRINPSHSTSDEMTRNPRESSEIDKRSIVSTPSTVYSKIPKELSGCIFDERRHDWVADAFARMIQVSHGSGGVAAV